MNRHDDDEIDEGEIWEGLCVVAAKHAGISIERAQAVLENAGYHAYGHIGILDAVNVVRHAVGMPELKADTEGT
jgi:hypothetical protein